ncbi:hypothetical protein LCM20_10230 [Halobacillus litoralis]|uniref:hypothetical protein n=1 Tax=Halobacillus litoralis TaxID=45668 RepID=UPI001CD285CD|nr:hypothetical protein [Halobacillus litoralis]MCA0970968.1 hypothetical protein [Halobacillus litoralis]
MKQVTKNKRSIRFDLHINEVVEMKTRTILDMYWDDILITAVIPSSRPFRATIELYSDSKEILIARLDINEDGKMFSPTYMKEEFARRKALRDTFSEFSMKLFAYLNSYIEYGSKKEQSTTDHHEDTLIAEEFNSWEFPYLERHPDLQEKWIDLKERTAKQYKRIEELDIEEKFSLETMVDRDVPSFIESFESLSSINKEEKKDDLLKAIEDLRLFIEKLERKEEESHSQSFEKKKGIISSKYNNSD